MKTKFYWLAFLASAAMIAQANAGVITAEEVAAILMEASLSRVRPIRGERCRFILPIHANAYLGRCPNDLFGTTLLVRESALAVTNSVPSVSR